MDRTLLIVEPSDIVRTGLLSIIKASGLFKSILEATDIHGMQLAIKSLSTPLDLVLLNPSVCVSGSIHNLISGISGLAIVAIHHLPLDEVGTSPFHAAINLSLTSAQIETRLTKVLKRKHPESRITSENTLSAREEDVLRLLVTGCSSKEIAEKLFISPHTVITHRKNISRKLNIRSVSGLTVYAILNNFISLDQL
jgi:DNA-binding CsgD family transcriptional regulator